MAAKICAQLADVSGLSVLHENGLLENNEALQLLCDKGSKTFSNWFNDKSRDSKENVSVAPCGFLPFLPHNIVLPAQACFYF